MLYAPGPTCFATYTSDAGSNSLGRTGSTRSGGRLRFSRLPKVLNSTEDAHKMAGAPSRSINAFGTTHSVREAVVWRWDAPQAAST